jgi:hypothetical protein
LEEHIDIIKIKKIEFQDNSRDFKSKISDLTNKFLEMENNNSFLKQEVENGIKNYDKLFKESELKINKMNSKINEYVNLNTDL